MLSDYVFVLLLQVLYEAVFARSGINVPFFIYVLHPRKLIPYDCLLSECGLITPVVVVTELSKSVKDIFKLFPLEVCA